MLRTSFRAGASALVLVAAVAFGAAAPAVAADAPPIAAFAALPAISSLDISPDGSMVAYVRRDGEQSQAIVQNRAGEMVAAVDLGTERARGVFWASPDHLAIRIGVIGRADGVFTRGEFSIVDILNVRTNQVVRAMRNADREALGAVGDAWRGTYNGQPVLYVEGFTREPTRYQLDIYRIDLASGRGRMHFQGGDWTAGYLMKPDGEVVARTDYNRETGDWAYLTKAAGWRPIMSENAPLDTPSVGGFGRATDTSLMFTDDEGEYAVSEINLATGEIGEPTAYPSPVSNVLRAADGRLIGVGYMEHQRTYQYFDEALAAQVQRVQASLPGRNVTLASMSDDQKVLAFYSEGAGDSGTYYLFDTEARRVAVVGRPYPTVQGEALGEVRVVRYKAADGMDLVGYLTLPPGKEPRNLPLVLMPHGGPAARDEAGFDWWSQAMAAQGYAVFQPQFRGSDGFGNALLEAGYGEWGRKMQSDLSDGVRHLVAAGAVDASRVCIVGASYGGYAALAGMTMEPGVYRCAVAVAPVSDLRAMLQGEEKWRNKGSKNSTIRYWSRFMGVENSSDPRLTELSPTSLASRAQGPILLIHGRDDTTVPYDQSTRMQSALQAAGKSSRLVTLTGEDHYLSLPATRQQMLTETLSFLAANNPAD